MAAPKNPGLAHRVRPPDVGRGAAGTLHRIDHAREFDQGAVAHQLDDTALKLSDCRINELCTTTVESGKGAGLILAHYPAIADEIRAQDCSKPAFDALT